MAFRPSQRSLRPRVETEPDLTPIMNLMVVLIPLLLTSAQFIKLGMIEINLPPAISASEMQNRPKEIDKRLDLTVTITDKGFYLASSFTGTGGLGVATTPLRSEPTTPATSPEILLVNSGIPHPKHSSVFKILSSARTIVRLSCV